jgi:two-component system, NarL family, sensor histidine kinase DesK
MSTEGPAVGRRIGLTGYPSRGARIAGTVFTGVWLLYLIGGVAYLVTHRYSALYIGAGLAIIVVFSALYLILVPNWPSPGRYRLSGLAALALLAAAFCVFYGQTGAVALWIFVSSASGLLVENRRRAARAVLGCIACYVIFSRTTHVDGTTFLGNVLPVFIGFAMIGLRRQFELTAELTRAREEVAKLAASEERLRLARDLHDLTGQSLSMISLKSELAARLLRRLPAGEDRDRAIAETEEVAAVGRQTLHDIREAVSGYRRPTLAVEVITARSALESAGITPHDEADLIVLSGTFDPEAEAALAWCLREAVTNAIRHSGARNCHIGLARRERDLSLEVRDDGVGYGAAAEACPAATGTGATGTGATGTGLRGMSERLAAVGGHLAVRPSGGGFALVATVPATVPADATGRDQAGKRRGVNVTS